MAEIDARVRFARRRAAVRLGPRPDLEGLSPAALWRAAEEVRVLERGTDDDVLAAEILRLQLTADYRLASIRGAVAYIDIEPRSEIERVIAGRGHPRVEPRPASWSWPK